MLVRSMYVVARYSRYHNRGCAIVQSERRKQRRETKTASDGLRRREPRRALEMMLLDDVVVG